MAVRWLGRPDKPIDGENAAMTATVAAGPLQSLRQQLSKLRHLSQPFFLPLDQASGWQFLWLLVSLLFCVGGLVLALLTGIIRSLEQLQPALTEKYFGGVAATISGIWSSWWGIGFASLFILGAASFVAFRQQLRQRRWLHWLLLGVIVVMLLSVNGINAGIGFIARDLTNALVEKQEANFYRILIIYAACFVVALPIRISQFFFTYKLSNIWRDWLSKSLIGDYMSNRAYYVLNPNDEQATDVDNPDQRITEDTYAFTFQSLGFTIGIFDALLTFSLNILILWSISQVLTFSLFGYSADNAESIAFYAGEEPESQETRRRLDTVIRNFNLIINWRVIIDVMRRTTNYAGNFFPYLVMAPAFFMGEVDYGGFVQASFAYGMVEGSLFFIVNQIEELAKFTAGISRLEGFQSKVEEVSTQPLDPSNQIIQSGGGIVIRHADLYTPKGDLPVIRDLNLSVNDHERMLVVGPSGCGKTSLMRMISGLWSPRRGTVERPETGDLLFIPQKPYMLLGSLREQLCYPSDEERFSDAQLRSVLEQVNLPQLVSRYPDLDIKQDWPRILSLGEQQRLAFGRLLLNSPRYVVLDEATSALDVKTEKLLYELLVERDLAFISVGHRPSLKSFHTNVLQLEGNGDWRLMPAVNYDPEAA